ncbi:hypothetical protein ACED29_07045 [Shewanella sp. 5S214]|uniref:hypothetical protein n=1 Tax=Shewanella sp. 5S214 TaxID=3229999 RepID=UPI00352D0463
MSTKFKHEKSVENIFKDNFEEAAREKGYIYTSASLDGQDRLVGADYLFTNHASFSIVEFKYREGDLLSEVKKEKRLQLCKALHENTKIRPLHNKCHFAAWSDNKEEITIEANIYYNEVCNKEFWGDSFSHIESPTINTRQSENDFIDSFLVGKEGASFKVFNEYMQWLLNLGDETNTNGYLELLVSNPFNRRAAGVPFTSVEMMQKWVADNAKKLAQANTRRNGRSGPGGSGGRFG